jgi:hypothetical protein
VLGGTGVVTQTTARDITFYRPVFDIYIYIYIYICVCVCVCVF